ncbi:LysR family substrate-binding domain-containing protein [Cupriavidus sp. YAF13]|uniref:LysR family substrate-binding domain-containing protein n=1 Tax=Cupriavidus sp. YAF13 TaxID=3233075 RepID=UPI003F8E8C66
MPLNNRFNATDITQASRMLLCEALLTRARDIVADLDSTRKMVLRVADGLEDYLRIGIINSVMYGPLPRTMRLFQVRNPAVEWTLHEMLPDQQGEALVRGQIDVGFASSATGREELRSIRVDPQPLMAALPAGHPLAASGRIRLKALAAEPFVLLNTQSPVIRSLLAACVRNGFHPRVLHESVDPQTVLSLVGAGVGVSALPRSLSGAPREDVAFLTLDEPGLAADLYATVRRDHGLPALDPFLTLLEDVTEVWHRETFGEGLRST